MQNSQSVICIPFNYLHLHSCNYYLKMILNEPKRGFGVWRGLDALCLNQGIYFSSFYIFMQIGCKSYITLNRTRLSINSHNTFRFDRKENALLHWSCLSIILSFTSFPIYKILYSSHFLAFISCQDLFPNSNLICLDSWLCWIQGGHWAELTEALCHAKRGRATLETCDSSTISK